MSKQTLRIGQYTARRMIHYTVHLEWGTGSSTKLFDTGSWTPNVPDYYSAAIEFVAGFQMFHPNGASMEVVHDTEQAGGEAFQAGKLAASCFA